MVDPEKLKKLLDEIVKDPSLKMKEDGTTFCNVGLNRAAKFFEYTGFTKEDGEPLTAREMITAINRCKSGWLECSGKQAADYVQRGGWGVAFMTNPTGPHDHIATIYPAPMTQSGSLGREVPQVANCGKKNAIMRSSEAFPTAQGEASYAIFLG